MATKTKKIYRASFWDKNLKKNVWKSYNIKNFDNDESKILEALEKWKVDSIKKMEDEYIKKKETKEDQNNIISIDQNNIISIDQNNIISIDQNNIINPNINIKYTPFHLKIASKEDGGTSTIIFGASKSGKTYQLIDIINKYYNNNKFIVFIMADAVNNSPAYKNLPKDVIKLDHFDEDLIERVHHIQKSTNNKYRMVFILDDLIIHKNSPLLLKMMLTYRNCDISTIILLQSTTLLNKNSRFNLNNCIMRRSNNNESIEQIMRFFLGGYEPFYSLKTMDEKINLYREITTDYGFIYLDALSDELSFHKKI